MEIALFEAKKAAAVGEVPIGAVIRDDLTDTILVSTHNKVEQLLDPTAHAEILAIREATSVLGTKVLQLHNFCDARTLCYVCASYFLAKLKRLIFGAYDPKGGGVAWRANI